MRTPSQDPRAEEVHLFGPTGSLYNQQRPYSGDYYPTLSEMGGSLNSNQTRSDDDHQDHDLDLSGETGVFNLSLEESVGMSGFGSDQAEQGSDSGDFQEAREGEEDGGSGVDGYAGNGSGDEE